MARTAEDLLQELMALDESQRIEAKRCTQVDRSVMESVCAFANEPGLGGGYLLLGVERDGHDLFNTAYRVVGVTQPDKLQADLASQCASVFNRPLRPRVSVEALHGKTVLVVEVPEAAPTDKPLFVAKLGLPRGAFRRIGSTDQESSEDDLIALYAGHQRDAYDAAVLADADMGDIDAAALDDYRQQRRAINPLAEELAWSDAELLRALGCAQRDGDTLKPTVAGVLLFGTAMALRRCFPMMRIDYIRVPGRQWVENPDHRFDTLEILPAARGRIGPRGRADAAPARDPRGRGQCGDAPQLPHPRGHADHPLRQQAGNPQPRPFDQGRRAAGRAGQRNTQPAHRGRAA
jgi:ATP-dependent DNA helicase RecG